MRLKAINYIFLAWTATALTSDASEPKPRPPRRLHQIKEMIVNEERPETKFYQIPGFDSVVIKAVPKIPTERPPIVENIPPNSQIGIIRSYLGTNTLNDTFNALQGVNNLLHSGILDAHGELDELTFLKPTSVQNIHSAQINPVKPCSTPTFISPALLKPIRIPVAPPRLPQLVPTQYSYKKVKRDGPLTTYTSSLDLHNGVKVPREGKTHPFFIDKIRKIPVHLLAPESPKVSKIIFSNPFDVTYGHYPVEVIHQQLHHDDRLTTDSGLPSINRKHNGPVVATKTGKAIPPPPVFFMDRIEKVAATASYPKASLIQPKPMLIDAAAGHVLYSDPSFLSRVPVSGPGEYSDTNIYHNERKGGNTIAHSAPDTFDGFGKNPAVFLTEQKLSAPLVHQFSFPQNNPFRPPAPGFSGFPYNQVYSDGKIASFTGSGTQEYAGVNVAVSAPMTPEFQGMPSASRLFSYNQVGNGKATTYNAAGIVEEGRGVNPAVMVHAVNVHAPHIADRIEKVAAGAKFNRPPLMLNNPFIVPVPTGFVHIPSVHTRIPQVGRSGMNPFVYNHIHRDGSVSSFGDGAVTVEVKSQVPNMATPIPPGYHRVFETPINTGPFPVEVNPNAVKPSTPVSYSYKLVNNGPVNIQEESIDGYQNNITPPDVPVRNNQPFPMPPPMPVMPAPAPGCVDREITYSNVGPSPVVFQETDAVKLSTPVSGSYSYKLVNNGPVNIQEGSIDGYQNNITPPDVPVRNNQPFPVPPPMPVMPAPVPGFVNREISYPNFSPSPVVFQETDAVKPSTPISGSYSYKLVNNGPVNIQEGSIDGYQNNITPPDVPVRNNQRFPVPSPMPVMPAPVPGFVNREISYPNVGPFPIVFQEPVIPLSYTYEQINHNKPGEFLVVKVEDPVRDIKKVHERLQNNRANQRYPNGFPTGEAYPNPYYFVPPSSNGPAPTVPQIPQDTTPPSFSYKQVHNEGVYDYSNNFGSTGVKTNNPITSETIENPQDNLVGNVEPTPLEIASSNPILNNRNALANNPIVVPERTSFSFKQSNMDGSSITVKDSHNGQNSVSVDVEPARHEFPQGQEPSRFDIEEDGAAPSPAPVQRLVAPTGSDQTQEAAKAETTARRPMVRRRKIKRVMKPRGDIPDAES